ncbi:hypothetical protein [Streptomyces olivaceoviridis]|uniref:hypothetical protein n=1 Tax=Streptomyces olivaceoviridis TaxID=1921 RepID=UPI0036F9BE31
MQVGFLHWMLRFFFVSTDQYRDVCTEAQLRMPERVLDLAAGFSHDLGAVYGMVRRLDDGTPGAGDSPAAVRENIDELWGRLRRMRRGIARPEWPA